MCGVCIECVDAHIIFFVDCKTGNEMTSLAVFYVLTDKDDE